MVSNDRENLGGNFQYVDLFISQVQDATTEAQVETAKQFVEQRVFYDISDELKKSSNSFRSDHRI